MAGAAPREQAGPARAESWFVLGARPSIGGRAEGGALGDVSWAPSPLRPSDKGSTDNPGRNVTVSPGFIVCINSEVQELGGDGRPGRTGETEGQVVWANRHSEAWGAGAALLGGDAANVGGRGARPENRRRPGGIRQGLPTINRRRKAEGDWRQRCGGGGGGGGGVGGPSTAPAPRNATDRCDHQDDEGPPREVHQRGRPQLGAAFPAEGKGSERERAKERAQDRHEKVGVVEEGGRDDRGELVARSAGREKGKERVEGGRCQKQRGRPRRAEAAG